MWRFARRVLVVAVVLAVALGVGRHLYGGSERERYEARVAALRAAGQPTRFEDLATPLIPDEENGAKLLKEAHRLLEQRRRAPGNAEDLLYADEPNAEEQVSIAAYLDSLTPYFELLARVPERPGWRLDLDWTAGIATRVDLPSQLMMASLHVRARAEFGAHEGSTERAADAAALLLALGGKCRGPFLLGYLVSESMAGAAAVILRDAMRQPGFDAGLFRRIVDPPLARSVPDRGPPRSVFVQERVFGIGAVEAIRAGAPYHSRDKERTISFLRQPRLYRDANVHLDAVEKALACCDTTPENALAAAAELDAEPDMDTMFGNTAKMYSRAFRLFADSVAGQRLTRVVMALLEYRQREGTWPESLAALGEMPNDPYGGGPFLYERTEHGCRVRSAKDATREDLEESALAWTLEDDQIPAMAR